MQTLDNVCKKFREIIAFPFIAVALVASLIAYILYGDGYVSFVQRIASILHKYHKHENE